MTSLASTDVAALLLADVDLSECRFQSAHNLDKLRLEGDILFRQPPVGWHPIRIRGRTVALGRYVKRRVLLEEADLRSQGHARAWWPQVGSPLVWAHSGGAERRIGAHHVAGLYRSLRLGREAQGDTPGAGDFYYGEMEMRRLDSQAGRFERAVLGAYWLLSGYGLQASRAILGLLTVVLALSAAFQRLGAPAGTSYAKSVLTVLEPVVHMRLLPPDYDSVGATILLTARLFGGGLFVLAVLAVRNRVKR